MRRQTRGVVTNLLRLFTRRLSLFCIALFFLGCGRRPTIAPVSSSSVIMAFGDSLTEGTGAEPEQSYPGVLATLLGCRVINAGLAGEETNDGLPRLRRLLHEERVNLVILCEGGNDMLSRQNHKVIQQNLEAMLDIIRAAGADAILIGVPQPGLRVKVPAFYRKIAEDRGVPCDCKTLEQILSSLPLKSDPIHPNSEGYRMMAAAMATLIRESQRP